MWKPSRAVGPPVCPSAVSAAPCADCVLLSVALAPICPWSVRCLWVPCVSCVRRALIQTGDTTTFTPPDHSGARPDVATRSGPPLKDALKRRSWGVGRGSACSRQAWRAPAAAVMKSLLTARACWTMDSPTEDAIASESTRMWCAAKSRVAMRDAPYAMPSQCTPDFGARAKEPRSQGRTSQGARSQGARTCTGVMGMMNSF